MANEKNLVPLNKRTPKERREIQRKGGAAGKGIRRPTLWRCKSCPYAKDKTCSPGLSLLKNAGKTIKRPDGSTYKVEKSPKCVVPEARRIVLESATNPHGLLKMTKQYFIEAALNAHTIDEKLKVGLATLKLAAHIDPPIHRQITLTADVDINKALEIVHKVLMRRKHWQPAIKAIREEFETAYGDVRPT